MAIYASEWAAKTALENYTVDPRKIKVVPLGANLEFDGNELDINKIIRKRVFDPLKLLFIGVRWKRKGGNKAVEVTKQLNKFGIPTELHIVGCDPQLELPSFAKVHGFITRKTKTGKNRLKSLFLDSHFLIVPSEEECFGIVFAEASSFGLPSLATNVGGIPSAVIDGINGKTFSLLAAADAYCDFIISLINNKEKYFDLSLSSYREYRKRLNWTVSGEKIKSLILEY